MSEPESKLAVIIIIAHKAEISAEEKASLRQCYAILGKHPIRLICPEGLNVSCYREIIPDAVIEFIDPKWQSTYRMFNKLKINPLLYKKYSDYQFMLYYELDAWVFSDQMELWCKSGYDYLGSPWVEKNKNGDLVFQPVGGNGGFSLRNIRSHLETFSRFKIMMSPSEVWKYHRKFHNTAAMLIRLPFILMRMMGYQNNSRVFMLESGDNEDIFWCTVAKKINPELKIAPSEICRKFSFEKYPSELYKLNNNVLPFGCHAWEKYEPEFWKPFIEAGKRG